MKTRYRILMASWILVGWSMVAAIGGAGMLYRSRVAHDPTFTVLWIGWIIVCAAIGGIGVGSCFSKE